MSTTELKRRLLALAAFILPLLAVKAASFVFSGPGPQVAQAGTPESTPTKSSNAPAAIKWSEQQLAAQSRIQAIESQLANINPLLYVGLEPEKPEVPEPPPEIPVVIEVPKIEPPPSFQLTVVMSSARGDTALIDGRPYRVGDQVRNTDWQVQSIHVLGRTVTLMNVRDRRMITIMVELPLLRE